MRQIALSAAFAWLSAAFAAAAIGPAEMSKARAAEAARVDLIQRVRGSVVMLYPRSMAGGGSGVLIDGSGLALTNHHVMQPIDENGLAALSDGQLYEVTWIGSDPGGDLSLVRLEGAKTFPASALGDSAVCKVGDWVVAMGNPFSLAFNYQPTVTLGVISARDRYVAGRGGLLVYGRCLQIDTSINPGNSGGPLFDTSGGVVGINGRIATERRGPINVGFGYSIASEQVKNFLSDLRATKLCLHGTLNAVFRDDEGRVVCGEMGTGSPLATAGMKVGDELVSIDGIEVTTPNQLAGILSVYPADWPVDVCFVGAKGKQRAQVRMQALPYPAGAERALGLKGEPGKIRDLKLNRQECARVLSRWHKRSSPRGKSKAAGWRIRERVFRHDELVGEQAMKIATDGRYRLDAVAEDGAPAGAGARGWDGRKAWHDVSEAEDERGGPVLAGADPWQVWIGMLSASPDKQSREMTLEGGDKVEGVRTDRIAFTDRQGQARRVWIELLDEQGFLTGDMVRASDGRSDWLVDDVREIEGVRVPHRRRLVTGVDGRVEYEVRVVAVEPVAKWDKREFDAP